jgi:hypothetical protein
LNSTTVRLVGHPLLLIAIILFGTYVIVIHSTQVVYVPPPVITPIIPIYFNYPDTIELTTNKTGLQVAFVLYADSPIAENTIVNVESHYAAIISTAYGNVSFVRIVFEETVPANFNLQPTQGFIGEIQMGPWWNQPYPSTNASRLNPVVLAPMAIMPFKWLVSGDYSPTIQIQFYNDSTILQYTYQEIKIHVASLIDIQNQQIAIENQNLTVQNENLNKLNTVLTYALVAVAFAEGFRMVEDFARDQDKNHS